jgi:hypothetical protein
MTLRESWSKGIGIITRSNAFQDTVFLTKIVLIVVVILGILVTITFLLRRFFKNHMVNRAHKILIYLFTMAGVLALIIGGLLGIALPIIPGIPLLIGAFLLMRKYHRWEWLERKIAPLEARLRRRKPDQEKVNKSEERARK